jgi:hypothetical protein
MLKDCADYDYIIWFHTENMRDIKEIIIDDPDEGRRMFPDFSMSTNFEQVLNYVCLQNYQYAQAMFEEYSIPFIVIGGQSPVDPAIQQFDFAQHVITSWLQELLESDQMPPANTFLSWKKIKHILDHYKINEAKFVKHNLDSLQKADQLAELAKKSVNFPDGVHPGQACHASLATRILMLIDTGTQS